MIIKHFCVTTVCLRVWEGPHRLCPQLGLGRRQAGDHGDQEQCERDPLQPLRDAVPPHISGFYHLL